MKTAYLKNHKTIFIRFSDSAFFLIFKNANPKGLLIHFKDCF